jgi:hypothetical protein
VLLRHGGTDCRSNRRCIDRRLGVNRHDRAERLEREPACDGDRRASDIVRIALRVSVASVPDSRRPIESPRPHGGKKGLLDCIFRDQR